MYSWFGMANDVKSRTPAPAPSVATDGESLGTAKPPKWTENLAFEVPPELRSYHVSRTPVEVDVPSTVTQRPCPRYSSWTSATFTHAQNTPWALYGLHRPPSLWLIYCCASTPVNRLSRMVFHNYGTSCVEMRAATAEQWNQWKTCSQNSHSCLVWDDDLAGAQANNTGNRMAPPNSNHVAPNTGTQQAMSAATQTLFKDIVRSHTSLSPSDSPQTLHGGDLRVADLLASWSPMVPTTALMRPAHWLTRQAGVFDATLAFDIPADKMTTSIYAVAVRCVPFTDAPFGSSKRTSTVGLYSCRFF